MRSSDLMPKKTTEKQRHILEACQTPTHIKNKKDEDTARRLYLMGLLDRAASPVSFQRRYVLTEAGRAALRDHG